MAKEATYLDTIHDAHHDLLGVKSRLDDISLALRTIGLKELGYDLNEMASIIGGSVKAVNGAISLQLDDHVRATEQTSRGEYVISGSMY